MALLEILCSAEDPKTLFRLCVDCGKRTGNYCDGIFNRGPCFAAIRVPAETQEWAQDQSTPLCNECEKRFLLCRFCRGVHSATPPAWGSYPSGWQ